MEYLFFLLLLNIIPSTADYIFNFSKTHCFSGHLWSELILTESRTINRMKTDH